MVKNNIPEHSHLGPGDGGEIQQIADPYTDEKARDAFAAALVGGSGVAVSVDDENNTVTLSSEPTSGFPFPEDANSPFSASAGEIDGDLDGSYRHVIVEFINVTTSPDNGLSRAQLNGDTGNVYGSAEVSGDGNNGESGLRLVPSTTAEQISGVMRLWSLGGITVGWGMLGPEPSAGGILSMRSEWVYSGSGPITDVRVFADSTPSVTDGQIRVWGGDV